MRILSLLTVALLQLSLLAPAAIADEHDLDVRKITCVKGQDGLTHCGNELAARRDACIVDNEGAIWCGEVVARADFPDIGVVCVTNPCPGYQVEKDDVLSGIALALDQEIVRYSANQKRYSD